MPVIDVVMFSEQKEGSESFVGTWLKHPGDAVGAHEPVVEISTDKVSMEIAAPEPGILTEILKAEGDPVAPGEVLARIETGSATASPVVEKTAEVRELPQKAESPADLSALSPPVRRLIEEHGLDAAAIPPTGRGNRLTHQDVVSFIERRKSSAKSRMVPHTAMRRSIAAHMARSMQNAPHVTSMFEADLTHVLSDRESRKGAGPAPSITAYLVRAAVKALTAVPEANSRWHDNGLEIFDDFNIGVGAAIEGGGLVVPVIRRAQTMSLAEIGIRLRDLTEAARNGKLAPEDMEGGTFTISNHGVSGSLLAAPIILANSQAAILGAGKLQKRAVVVDDTIQIRPMMYVTLTIDHRALDAQQTNAFLSVFVQALEAGS